MDSLTILFVLAAVVLIPLFILACINSVQSQKATNETMNAKKEALTKSNFSVTAQETTTNNRYSILVDDAYHRWTILCADNNKQYPFFKYSDLLEYSIVEDGESILQGRVGSAITGALLFGGIGAIAGAARSKKIKNKCRSMEINIVLVGFEDSLVRIPLITYEVETSSTTYVNAQNTAKRFSAILANIKYKAEEEKQLQTAINTKTIQKHLHPVDEISKYYELKEKGIITEAEFNAKKTQLLGVENSIEAETIDELKNIYEQLVSESNNKDDFQIRQEKMAQIARYRYMQEQQSKQ